MNPNVDKTTFILFFHKMSSIVFRYKLGLTHLTPIPHVLKDLGGTLRLWICWI
jgi:hypothetical protein